MFWKVARTVTGLLFVIASAGTTFAQAPAPVPAAPLEEPTTRLDRLKEPDQGGGLHFTKHLAIVFGGIKAGSGIALGPALSHKFADGAYAQIKAVYSVKNFSVVQARYDSRKFWRDRAALTGRLRWQNAPQLRLFRLGPDAPDLTVGYGERKTEGSARLRLQLTPAFRLGSGFGVEKYHTTGGRIDLAGAGSLPSVPAPPGLGSKPWFAHSFVSAAVDSRTSPDYSRSGRLLEGTVHHFHDLHDGQDAFGRFEGTAQQLIPTHGGKGVIELAAQTWLSLSSGDRSLPFFLMPTLGGSNYLRAYPSYRFRDRHALFLKGEYRWAVHKMVDVAGMVEAGRVAPTVKGLRSSDMAESVGAGLRVHTKTSNVVDLDVAHGRDGFKFTIGFNTGGS
jgi:surface antigen Omp85-like protein